MLMKKYGSLAIGAKNTYSYCSGSAINIFPQRHHSCEVRTVCVKKCFSQSLEKTVIMSLNYQQSKQLKLQNVF